MLKTIAFGTLLFASAPMAAQDAMDSAESTAADRHLVEPGNNWSITQSDCSVDVGVGEGGSVQVNPHDDHHDLGIFDPKLQGAVDRKIVPVSFATGGVMVSGRRYEALGHRDPATTGYVASVDIDLLDRIAADGSLQFHRGRKLLADLDMTGFGPALAAMRACEARMTTAEGADDAAAAAADDMEGPAEEMLAE